MNHNFSLLVKVIFILLDLLMLNFTFLTVLWYMFEIPYHFNGGYYLFFWIVCNFGWLGASWLHGLYHPKFTAKFRVFTGRTMQAYFVFFVFMLVYLYFNKQYLISRIFVSTFLISFFLSLFLNRIIYFFARFHFGNKDNLIKRVMIIGYNDMSKNLAAYFEKNESQIKIVGYCEETEKVFELSNYPILGTPVNAVATSQKLKISEIYSTILPEQDHRIYNLMHLADQVCIRFKLVPDFSLYVNRPMHVNYLSGIAVLSPRTEPLDDLGSRIKKRFFDVVISSLTIIFILSWLIPLIALVIWLDSRGPIFFIQKRSGLNNKPFNCIKFRSMYVNKEANKKQAARKDERFTRVGKFIRKTSLDEFPQFLNVLRGDMSIVGPRPHMIKHTEDYSAIINQYMVRQFLKPGITGWAQINGFSGDTTSIESMQGRVDHDLWYMENWNTWLDFKIIFLTSYNLIKGEKNAY